MKPANQKKKDRYAKDVEKWMKVIQKREYEDRLASKEVQQIMDDNFHYNLNNGFELMGYRGRHRDLSATEIVLLECAECMSSNESERKQPYCDLDCRFYNYMSREIYDI
jgi:hypothetical protein